MKTEKASSAPPSSPSSSFFATADAAVAAALAAVLGSSTADRRTLLSSVGLDSLAGIELRDELRRSLGGLDLPGSLALDAPTVDALVERVAAALQQREEREGRKKGGGGEVSASVSSSSSSSRLAKTALSPVPPPPPLLLSSPASSTATLPIAIDCFATRMPVSSSSSSTAATINSARIAPLERWDCDADAAFSASYSSSPSPSTSVALSAARFGHFLSRVSEFDPSLFGMNSLGEVARMDPQQRLVLEVGAEVLSCWNEKERNSNGGDGGNGLFGDGSGGTSSSSCSSSITSVATCLSFWDSSALWSRSAAAEDAYGASGKCLSVSSGRLSFTFDLKGQAFAVDTACSSSLVAAELLARELRSSSPPFSSRKRQRSILAAALLSLDPANPAGLAAASMLSPYGRAKALDASSDGYSRGEAALALGLSLFDGAAVAAAAAAASTSPSPGSPPPALLIASVQVNRDGRSSSLTAPSGPAQAAVVAAALASSSAAAGAATSPSRVSALELHGTGTPLGDPLEVGALVGVLRRGASCENARSQSLSMGAPKTRTGHAEPAAGAVGLLAAAVRHAAGACLPVAHLRQLSAHVREALVERGRVTAARGGGPNVVADGGGGDSGGSDSVVGVSAFAFQGTNAHKGATKRSGRS